MDVVPFLSVIIVDLDQITSRRVLNEDIHDIEKFGNLNVVILLEACMIVHRNNTRQHQY